MNTHEKLNYVEFPSKNLPATKAFFSEVFSWSFTDFGEEYTAFTDQGLDGGFFASDSYSRTEKGSALVVFYSEDLEKTESNVIAAGGEVIKPIFSFPGGRRFHFVEPGGNELGVWSDKGA